MQRTDILVDSIYAQGTVPVRKENAKTQLAGPNFESLCVVFA